MRGRTEGVNLRSRGVAREGSLADLVVFDPELERTASADEDPSRSDYTPFEGWSVTGWPVIAIRRGDVVYEDGRVTGQPGRGRALPNPRDR